MAESYRDDEERLKAIRCTQKEMAPPEGADIRKIAREALLKESWDQYWDRREEEAMKSSRKMSHIVGDILFSMFLVWFFFIPTWFFLFVRYLLDPQGFWQRLVVFGLGLWFLGFFQVFLFIVLCIVLISFWGRSGR